MTGPERERYEILVTAAVDGELDITGRKELESILEVFPELRIEMEDQMQIKEVVGTLRFVEPPEEIWDVYQKAVLFKMERRIGWSLFLSGVALLMGYGGWIGLSELWMADDISFLVKGGVSISMGGLGVLLASLIRERMFLRTRERYEGVIR